MADLKQSKILLRKVKNRPQSVETMGRDEYGQYQGSLPEFSSQRNLAITNNPTYVPNNFLRMSRQFSLMPGSGIPCRHWVRLRITADSYLIDYCKINHFPPAFAYHFWADDRGGWLTESRPEFHDIIQQ